MTTATAPRSVEIANQLSPFHIIVLMVMESARHNYIAARVFAGLSLISCMIFGPLEWTYDMKPTLVWLEAHGMVIQSTLAVAYGQAVASTLVLILPLTVKGLTAQMVGRIKIFGTLFLAAELFESITNWDAAWSLLFSFAPQWAEAWPTSPLQAGAAWLAFGLALLVTTSLFQVLFIGSALCLVVALFNSFKTRWVGWVAVVALGIGALVWIVSLG